MATSRGATPADPTLVATTTDEARGGLFARSNLGNTAGQSPQTTTDTHVNNVTFDPTSRTLTVTLTDGTTFTPTIPGGDGGGTGTDIHLESVAFDNNTRQLSFTLVGGGTVAPVTIPAGTVDPQALADAIAEYFRLNPITESFTDLTDTPMDYTGANAGDVIRVNQAGNGLEFGTSSATVDNNSFQDNDSITFSNAPGGRVSARLSQSIVGGGQPTSMVTIGNDTITLSVDNQGLIQLVQGTVPPATPRPMGTVNTPAPTNILSTPTWMRQ